MTYLISAGTIIGLCVLFAIVVDMDCMFDYADRLEDDDHE